MINTSVLICCTNSEDSNLLSDVFLKHGLASTTLESTQSVKTLFESDGVDKSRYKFIVIGMDFAGGQGMELLQYINNIYFANKPQTDTLQLPIVIAMSVFTDEQHMKPLIANNVTAFLQRPLEERKAAHRISVLIYKYRELLPPKQAIFVEPDEQELMRGNYRLRNGRHETVRIDQVSIDGVRVSHYCRPDADKFNPEECDFIEHFIFEADDDIIDTDVRIIIEPTGQLYFEFTHFYGDSRQYLLDYIKSRMK
ncbi:MAG: hypothetical protein J6Y01_05125 [Spirochaetales bacterium]|nr:hypothetical protein [Spirochaetales bacterium]